MPTAASFLGRREPMTFCQQDADSRLFEFPNLHRTASHRRRLSRPQRDLSRLPSARLHKCSGAKGRNVLGGKAGETEEEHGAGNF